MVFIVWPSWMVNLLSLWAMWLNDCGPSKLVTTR